jgi:hypothetical protein
MSTMSKAVLLAGFWLATSVASVAFAQKHRPEMPGTRAEVQAQVAAQFAGLDRNKDGFLTPDELPGLPMPPHARGGPEDKGRLDRLFAMMDKDGNGEISKTEFDAFHTDHMRTWRTADGGGPDDRAIAGGNHPMPDAARMERWKRFAEGMMFRHADANHDGKVSLAEAQTAALARFDKIDTNHDGMLSDAEREAGRARMAERFRDPRAHWMMERRGDTPPAKPTTPSTSG